MGRWKLSTPYTEESTNHMRNPSFEEYRSLQYTASPLKNDLQFLVASGGLTLGTTVVSSTASRVRGNRGLSITRVGTTGSVAQSNSLYAVKRSGFRTFAVFSCYVSVLSGTAPASMTLSIAITGDAVSTVTKSNIVLGLGKLQRMDVAYEVSASGNFSVNCSISIPSGTGVIETDCWQLEVVHVDNAFISVPALPLDYVRPTDYFDGDNPGCAWLGYPNLSQSTRPAHVPGGMVVDVELYAGNVSGQSNTGMPQIENQLGLYAFGDGGVFQSSNAKPRSMSLSLWISRDTFDELQITRAVLARMLTPGSPVLLHRERSDGTPGLTLRAYYEGGLEIQNIKSGLDVPDVRLIAPDPYWYTPYDIGGSATIPSTSGTTNGVLVRRKEGWSFGGSPVQTAWSQTPDFDGGVVRCSAVHPLTGEIYIGGSFTSISSDVAMKRLVKYNPVTNVLSSVGFPATAGDVLALAFTPTGRLFAGGSFSGGGLSSFFSSLDTMAPAAAWGNFFSPTAYAPNNVVRAILATGGPNGDVLVGGDFTQMGAVLMSFLARFRNDPATTMSNINLDPLNGIVNCLAGNSEGKVWVGGAFTNKGYLALHDPLAAGSIWPISALGLNGAVKVAAVDNNDHVYFSGDFTIPTTRIGYYDGSVVRPLPGFGAMASPATDMLWDGKRLHITGRMGLYSSPDDPPYFIKEGGSYRHGDYVSTLVPSTVAVSGDHTLLGFDAAGNFLTSTVGMAIVNPSNSDIIPRITITGVGTLLGAYNFTTNAYVQVKVVLVAGQRAVLDFAEQVVKIRTEPFASAQNAVSPGSSMGSFVLKPGSNFIVFIFKRDESSAVSPGSVSITSRVRYPSVDFVEASSWK